MFFGKSLNRSDYMVSTEWHDLLEICVMLLNVSPFDLEGLLLFVTLRAMNQTDSLLSWEVL
jgi:hypothetical protein